MELIRGSASDRRFEGFVAEASDTLYRTGFLMTGDAGDAEDLSRRPSCGQPGGGIGCSRWIIRSPTHAAS
jgi:hypothetical protein